MKDLFLKSIALLTCLMSISMANAAVWVNGFGYDFNGNEASLVGCSHDGNVVIPERVIHNGNTYTVTSIGVNAFYCHHGVTSLRIPNTVTIIKNQAFIYADALKNVYIPSSVETIEGYAFYGNHSLSSVCCIASIPPNMYEQGFDDLEEGKVSLFVPMASVDAYKSAPYWEHFKNIFPIYGYDFAVDGIYYKDMGNGKVMVTNKDMDFNCYNGNVIIPETVTYNGVTYEVAGIGENAFLYCSNLTSLSLPVTITTIEEGAFTECSIPSLFITGSGNWTAGALGLSVDELFLESGVTSIAGMNVDANKIYCFAKNPPACDENTFLSYDGELHVPPTSFSRYFTADIWSNFINITGDANYVELTALELSHDNALLKIDEQLELDVAFQPDEPTYNRITWTSTNENVAVVNNGVITALSIGECDIIASCRTIRNTCHVTVVGDIRFKLHKAMVLPNHLISLPAVIKPASSNITVSSSDPSVAAARLVNGIIQVAGIHEGTATITITSVEGYDSPDTCSVTVYTELGDVNCDGYTDIDDVAMLIDYTLGNSSAQIKRANADVNHDNKIDIDDVTLLISHVLGTIDLNAPATETFNINGVVFKMIAVESGTFIMGATPEQGNDAHEDEYPTHEVTLSSFAIGETEVTQALWLAVMGNNPSDHAGDLNRPVDNVSWNECQTFISILNTITGKHFRLPTEAEWEFAARGGNESLGYKYAGSNTIDNVAWSGNNGDNTTHAVGTMLPNELGLFDMSGNLWEWVQDWYGNYSSNAQTNPKGPLSGEHRVRRGGSYQPYEGDYFRVSRRFKEAPEHQLNDVGLRLAL